MSFEFSQQNLEKIEQLKAKYPKPQALVLPLLWLVQEQKGYICFESLSTIAKICESFPMDIYKVATFYTMFNLEPIGKYHIQVCKTLSCKLCNQKQILSTIEDILQIKAGQTTLDKKFTLSLVECLGSCGTAPVMQINDIFYENLTPQSVTSILQELQGVQS
jgi:NADH-quinone oxidoreductase subunit E